MYSCPGFKKNAFSVLYVYKLALCIVSNSTSDLRTVYQLNNETTMPWFGNIFEVISLWHEILEASLILLRKKAPLISSYNLNVVETFLNFGKKRLWLLLFRQKLLHFIEYYLWWWIVVQFVSNVLLVQTLLDTQIIVTAVIHCKWFFLMAKKTNNYHFFFCLDLFDDCHALLINLEPVSCRCIKLSNCKANSK